MEIKLKTEQHALYTAFLPRPAGMKSNVPKRKSCRGLTIRTQILCLLGSDRETCIQNLQPEVSRQDCLQLLWLRTWNKKRRQIKKSYSPNLKVNITVMNHFGFKNKLTVPHMVSRILNFLEFLTNHNSCLSVKKVWLVIREISKFEIGDW